MTEVKPFNTSLNVNNHPFYNETLKEPTKMSIESPSEMFEIVHEQSHSNSQPVLRQTGGQCGDC